MATQEQVIGAIRRHLNNVDDGLFTIRATGRIMGFVASPEFAELDHKERQERLWNALNSELSPEETANVGPLTAMTPDEARLHAIDTD